MRVTAKKTMAEAEGDLTPMIDMTFQLIAFFMVLVNFSQAEQDARVQLPTSVLAKPPEESLDRPLTIQLARVDNTDDFEALVGGDEIAVGPPLEGILNRERRAFGRRGKKIADVIVIIRADKDVPAGVVQEVIVICQKLQFERFRLRAEEDPN